MEFVCRTYVKEFNKKKGEMFYRQFPDNVFVKDKGRRVDRQVKYNGKIQTVTFFVSQDNEWYNATEAGAGLKIRGIYFNTAKSVVKALNKLDDSKLKELCDFYQSNDGRLKKMQRFLAGNSEDTITYEEF